MAAAAIDRRDRVGLAWRPELAAGIHAARERIDVLEVVADNWFAASRGKLRALAALAADVPLLLHGVGMGLASAWPVPVKRIDAMARVIDAVRPEAWSEHLAFVRAGGVEIGDLAAPPRTEANVAGALTNLLRIERIVGTRPWLENIATLIDPPCSTLDEAQCTDAILRAGDASLLLDLHNLYANALNFGRDPVQALQAMPLARVRCVHLSGGIWVSNPASTAPRLLDDHLHDPPAVVYDLLTELARQAWQPLTVIIERDGAYPAMDVLCSQLDQARAALARGRVQARERQRVAA